LDRARCDQVNKVPEETGSHPGGVDVAVGDIKRRRLFALQVVSGQPAEDLAE
jgi:hypothetical protein